MLKFKSLQDIQMFLLETGRYDLLSTVKSADEIPQELFEIFIKGRSSIIPKLKDFRASQNSKAAWRQNRYKMLKGVRGFHKSTAGKRFHRSLGRFLANRNPSRESIEGSFALELCEFLKAISSVKTHFWIERTYYHSIDEEIDLLVLGEELLPALGRVEEAAMRLRQIEDDDADLLFALIDPNELQLEIADICKQPIAKVRKICTETYSLQDMNECGSFIQFVNKTFNILTK